VTNQFHVFVLQAAVALPAVHHHHTEQEDECDGPHDRHLKQNFLILQIIIKKNEWPSIDPSVKFIKITYFVVIGTRARRPPTTSATARKRVSRFGIAGIARCGSWRDVSVGRAFQTLFGTSFIGVGSVLTRCAHGASGVPPLSLCSAQCR
jgi:hypothetical protein